MKDVKDDSNVGCVLAMLSLVFSVGIAQVFNNDGYGFISFPISFLTMIIVFSLLEKISR